MEINWLATVLALAVGMVVAGVWYGKAFVALCWRLTGITPEESKKASRRNMVQLLAFSASTLLQHNAFELKPPRLTFLNSSYQLVLFLAMALVIGLL